MKQAKKTAKHHKVTYAHRKSYRKRHYAVLIACLALIIAILNGAVSYIANADLRKVIASQSVSDSTVTAASAKSVIASTYGFSLQYDADTFYAAAIDNSSGGLHVNSELATDRSYKTIRLSPYGFGKDQTSETVQINYYSEQKSVTDLQKAQDEYVLKTSLKPEQLKLVSTKDVTYDGIAFKRSEWQRETEGVAAIKTSFTSFTAIVNGSPFTAVIYQGLGGGDSTLADTIINDLSFSPISTAYAPTTSEVLNKIKNSNSVLDMLLLTKQVGAEAPTYTTSERVSATYGPAVVKIYNVYMGDFTIDGQVVLPRYLNGGTGSGFIVSNDGYVATNGHVVVNNPREIIISYALAKLQQGNSGPFQMLVTKSGLTKAELSVAKTEEEAVTIIIKKLYTIADSRFALTNKTENILVGLSDKQVDVAELVQQTQTRQKYIEQSTIKQATVSSYDYEGFILPTITKTFTKSDVALLKISGSGYPTAKLGEIASVQQGGNLSILGFPGVASSSNGILSKTETGATLTTGKVSSIKKDTRDKSLIETDTEIGHGNSGGPAFDDEGNVVGIATYTSDTGKAGDGTLNYIRDIADFKALLAKDGVDTQPSDTQVAWEKGMDKFYDAHYKSAITSFKLVKDLYPEHPKVVEFISTSEKRIAEGKNVDEFPVALAIAGGVVCILLAAVAGGTLLVIARHKKAHGIYAQHAAAGVAPPLTQGMQPQYIAPLQPQSFTQPQQWPVAPVNEQLLSQQQQTAQPLYQQQPAYAPQPQVQPQPQFQQPEAPYPATPLQQPQQPQPQQPTQPQISPNRDFQIPPRDNSNNGRQKIQ